MLGSAASGIALLLVFYKRWDSLGGSGYENEVYPCPEATPCIPHPIQQADGTFVAAKYSASLRERAT